MPREQVTRETPASEKWETKTSYGTVARYTLIIVGILIAVIFLWQIIPALLIGFIGLLMAVVFNAFAGLVERFTPLSRRVSLILVLLVLFLLAAGGITLFGAQVADQVGQLTESIPQTIQKAREGLEGHPVGKHVVQYFTQSSGSSGGGLWFTRIAGAAMMTMDGLFNLIVILFVGIFLASSPDTYKKGILHLFPLGRRKRLAEVLDESGMALHRWLLGTLVAMTFVFVTTTVGLMLIGVPQALVLGLIAGLFDFVPMLGPIAAAVPGLIVAFAHDPTAGVYACGLYLIIQQLEGNLVTPLAQQKAVSLPPVLVLLSLTAFGILFGMPGVIVATPLTVVLMVFVRRLYVEDTLGDRTLGDRTLGDRTLGDRTLGDRNRESGTDRRG